MRDEMNVTPLRQEAKGTRHNLGWSSNPGVFCLVPFALCLQTAAFEQPAAQPTLELEDFVETPIAGRADGKGSNELLLSRVNTLREEVGGARRFFISDLNGPLYIFVRARRSSASLSTSTGTRVYLYSKSDGMLRKVVGATGFGAGTW